MKKTTLLFALLLMGATVAKAQSAQPDFDDKYATELVKPGTAAPDFKMKTPDGKNFQFSKLAKGKTVVLDFWASWCPDCRKDAPEVVRLYEKYRQYGVEFIGIWGGKFRIGNQSEYVVATLKKGQNTFQEKID